MSAPALHYALRAKSLVVLCGSTLCFVAARVRCPRPTKTGKRIQSVRQTAALEHQQPRCAMLKLRRPPCFSQLCAAQRASSAAPGGPMACSASREAEAGRVSASRAGGHAPRTGERVARKSASRACFCVTVPVFCEYFSRNRAEWREKHTSYATASSRIMGRCCAACCRGRPRAAARRCVSSASASPGRPSTAPSRD